MTTGRDESMNKVIGIALLIVGVLLLVWGINASDSVGSQISETFSFDHRASFADRDARPGVPAFVTSSRTH